MKKLILALFLVMSVSSFAQVFQYRAGQFYSHRARVAPINCSYAYWNYGRCLQTCDVGRWDKIVGVRNGFVRGFGPYGGYAWNQSYVNGVWWSFRWIRTQVPSNMCY